MAQIVTECLVIVTVGGAAGVVASLWTTALLERLVGEAALSGAIQPPPWVTFDVNGPVLGFSLAAAAASVVMAGVVPALFASRTNPTDVLRDGSRSHTGRFVNRLSAWLVTAQIALTCALLVASLLLVRTIVNRQRQSLGYDGTAVMTARMNLETDYHTEKELRAVLPALLESLRSTPGVTHAALTSRRSPTDVNVSEFEIEGRAAAASPDDLPRASFEIVSDGYFAAIGLQPLRGREFTTADGPEDPVAIVNEPFAKKYFADSDAIGHRIRGNPRMPWVRIVGVVPETLMQGPLDSGESDGAGAFLPVSLITQSYVSVVARGHGAPEQLFEPLRRAVAKVNPNVALYARDHSRKVVRAGVARQSCHCRDVHSVCVGRTRSGDAWPVRRRLVRRQPAHARIRHPHSARRERQQSDRARPSPGRRSVRTSETSSDSASHCGSSGWEDRSCCRSYSVLILTIRLSSPPPSRRSASRRWSPASCRPGMLRKRILSRCCARNNGGPTTR